MLQESCVAGTLCWRNVVLEERCVGGKLCWRNVVLEESVFVS